MHDLYVRITYQLLVDERKIILMEQRVVRESMNGANGQSHHKDTDQMEGDMNGTNETTNQQTGSGLWHSRKSVVNTLKATISKKHVDSETATMTSNAEEDQMGAVVDSEEIIEALTMAEQDILRNLNDSLSRFRRTHELHGLIAENGQLLGT